MTSFDYILNSDGISLTLTKYTGDDTRVWTVDNISGIPVTHIGDKCFDGCDKVTFVNIMSSVSTIGKEIFKDCKNLKETVIHDCVKTKGKDIYIGCDDVKEKET